MAAIETDIPPVPTAPIPPSDFPAHFNTYLNARFNQFRLQIFDEIMVTVMDVLKPTQDQLALLSNARPSSSGLKVNTPAVFDGSRDKGEAFIHSCLLYFGLRPQDFPDVSTQIGWILTFMTGGRAQTWREEAIAYHNQHKRYRWDTMDAFGADFRTEFWPIQETEEALAALEGRGYFQRPSEIVDTYVDRFRELIKKAHLTDKLSIVIKFRRGLSESLVNTLADSPQPPASDNLEQWINRARNLERSCTLQKNISGSKPSLPPPRPTAPTVFRRRNSDTAPSYIPPIPKPTPPGVVPMDIDAHRARMAKLTCHRCKEPGHFANNCPHQFDIRFMSQEEIGGFQALAQDTRELQERQQESEEASEEAAEDFGSTSG